MWKGSKDEFTKEVTCHSIMKRTYCTVYVKGITRCGMELKLCLDHWLRHMTVIFWLGLLCITIIHVYIPWTSFIACLCCEKNCRHWKTCDNKAISLSSLTIDYSHLHRSKGLDTISRENTRPKWSDSLGQVLEVKWSARFRNSVLLFYRKRLLCKNQQDRLRSALSLGQSFPLWNDCGYERALRRKDEKMIKRTLK